MAALIVVVRRRRARRMLAASLAGLLVANVALVSILHAGWPPAGWQFVACDVGQGDALVVNAGQGQYVLVDSGPDPGVLRGCLSQLAVRALAFIVITHDHADHVEGLPGVLGRMPIGAVAVGPLREPALEWARVQRWAAEARVGLRPLSAGTDFPLAQSSWQVLGPRTVLHGTDSDPNNASLVMRVQLRGLSLLLTGDAEQPLQDQLLGDPGLSADVIKVPHHGSDRQEPAFFEDVHASTAIVSVGAGNSYGHPALRTLALLARDGAAVFRTDTDGAIAVLRSGSGRVTVVPRGRRGVAAPLGAGLAWAGHRGGRVRRSRTRPRRMPPASSTTGRAPSDQEVIVQRL
jgi:competence protein ComEC